MRINLAEMMAVQAQVGKCGGGRGNEDGEYSGGQAVEVGEYSGGLVDEGNNNDDGEDGEDEDDEDDLEMNDEEEVDLILTKEEQDALKEIDSDELDDDIEQFLKDTENINTKNQTESIVSRYHRIMSVVAKKEKREFLPLDSTPVDEIPKLLSRFFKIISL